MRSTKMHYPVQKAQAIVQLRLADKNAQIVSDRLITSVKSCGVQKKSVIGHPVPHPSLELGLVQDHVLVFFDTLFKNCVCKGYCRLALTIG